MIVRTPVGLIRGSLIAVALLAACASPPAAATDPPASPLVAPTALEISTAVPSAALSTPTPGYVVVTSQDQLLGTWHLGAEGLRFDVDGSFRMAHSVGGLDKNPFAIGSYKFQGDRVLISDIQVFGVPSCGSKIGKYEMRLLNDGRLVVVVMADACGPRADDMAGTYDPVN